MVGLRETPRKRHEMKKQKQMSVTTTVNANLTSVAGAEDSRRTPLMVYGMDWTSLASGKWSLFGGQMHRQTVITIVHIEYLFSLWYLPSTYHYGWML